MGANSSGHLFKYHSFGESHGKALGVVIDGCPSLIPVDLELLKKEMERRRPGKSLHTSPRNEPDQVEILSGVFEGKTLGTPIACVVYNQDQRSSDYDQIKKNPRPGHSEDLWKKKYGIHDHRGGGRSSGRETLSRVIAGAFARMLVRELVPEFKLMAFVRGIGDVFLELKDLDEAEKLFKKGGLSETYPLSFPHKKKGEEALKTLDKAKEAGDSLSSVVEVWMEGIPQGLGRPVFHKFKSDLASSVMSLGASQGMEIGPSSQGSSGLKFHKDSRSYGGLRGGLTTGERLVFRVSFKAPSSLKDVAKKGRFDPCIGIRAVPVLEALSSLVLADHLLLSRTDQI